MIVHCETCKIGVLETQSDRVAPITKDDHEIEHHKHHVNLYEEHRGRRFRIAGIIGPFNVDL
jgi:hypothetical protein